jgi:hypothetical protein
VAGELALLVGDDGGEELALGAFAVQERGADLVGERERVEHVLHRRVEQRVRDREEADGEVGVGGVQLAVSPEHLAHAGAQERELDELVRRVGRLGERHHRRPPSHRGSAEQRERLADRLDGAREREERRVDVAQELEGEPEVGADRLLELLERGIRPDDLGEHHQRREARPDAALAREVRLGEESALEVCEAEPPAAGEVLGRLDVGCGELQAARLRRLDLGGELLVAAALDRDADDMGHRGEPLVVSLERQRVPAPLQAVKRGERLVVDGRGAEQEYGAIGPDRRRPDLKQELRGDEDPHGMLTGEPVEPDVAESVEQEPGGGGRRVGVAADQLVPDHSALGIGDRPADDGDLVRLDRVGDGHGDRRRPGLGHVLVRRGHDGIVGRDDLVGRLGDDLGELGEGVLGRECGPRPAAGGGRGERAVADRQRDLDRGGGVRAGQALAREDERVGGRRRRGRRSDDGRRRGRRRRAATEDPAEQGHPARDVRPR